VATQRSQSMVQRRQEGSAVGRKDAVAIDPRLHALPQARDQRSGARGHGIVWVLHRHRSPHIVEERIGSAAYPEPYPGEEENRTRNRPPAGRSFKPARETLEEEAGASAAPGARCPASVFSSHPAGKRSAAAAVGSWPGPQDAVIAALDHPLRIRRG